MYGVKEAYVLTCVSNAKVEDAGRFVDLAGILGG